MDCSEEVRCGLEVARRDAPEVLQAVEEALDEVSTTVYNRYNRWAKQGVWLRVFERLSEVTPDSLHLIDSSIVRAHQHAAGGKKGARITPSVAPVGD